MSHGKCFYCECKLEENEGEVDHYIETSECPEKAFECRATMNAHEYEKLRSFADASSPFSLMFRAFLKSLDIEIP